MIFRWLTNREIETLVNPDLKRRGWAELNINEKQPTCRVIGAFLEDGSLVESLALQLYPVVGPMLRHDNTMRDSGETSRGLATIMADFMEQTEARDSMVIANQALTERLCQRMGMTRLSSPVYVTRPGE